MFTKKSGVVSASIRTAVKNSSWIRRMFEEGAALRAQLGPENVFDFSLGNPVLEPPAAFQKNLAELATNPPPGLHRYMPNAGFPETRAEIAHTVGNMHGCEVSGSGVVVTVGAAGAMNVFQRTTLEPGDEVIVMPPYFVEYDAYVKQHGGKIIKVDTDEAFMPDLDALAAAINKNTRSIIINTPNNPTGVAYPAETIDALIDLVRAKSQRYGRPIFLISDEPYRRVMFDEEFDLGSVIKRYEYGVVLSSFSKDLGLAGERIGYAVLSPSMPEEEAAQLMGGLIMSNRTLGFVNAPAIIQKAIVGATDQTVDIDWYRVRMNKFYSGLVDAGLDCVKPQGAFYLFPKSPEGIDDLEFSARLKQEGVLVVPGRGFGRANHVRMSYVCPMEAIENALPRIEKVVKACK